MAGIFAAVGAVAAGPVLAQASPATAAALRYIETPSSSALETQQLGPRTRQALHRGAIRAAPLRLKPVAQTAPDQVPEIDIRARDEWTAGPTLRVTPTRVAYKQRF